MLLEERVEKALRTNDLLLEGGHFVLKAGDHADSFANLKGIYSHVELTEQIGIWLSEIELDLGVELVVGPAMGGILLAHETAKHLGRRNGRKVHAAFAEKGEDGRFFLGRGYDKLVAGKVVLVVEDVLTTGSSVAETVTVVRAAGGIVLQVAAVWNRGQVVAGKLGDNLELSCLVTRPIPSWDAKHCHLCADGVPINLEHGRGRAFVERFGQPPYGGLKRQSSD